MEGGIVCFLVRFRKEGDSSLNSNLDEKVNQYDYIRHILY